MLKEKKGFRLAAPAHPGEIVRGEVMEPNRLGVAETAKLLGVKTPTLSRFINGHWGMSPLMALRLEAVFGISYETLMQIQASYDAAQGRALAPKVKHLKRFIPATMATA